MVTRGTIGPMTFQMFAWKNYLEGKETNFYIDIFFSGKHSKSRRPNSASSDHANSDSVNLKRGGPDSMNMKSESSSSAACDKVPNNINESPSSSLVAASGAVSGAGHNISSSSSASSSSSGKS